MSSVSATFYKWRAKYGGMDASMMPHLYTFDCDLYIIGNMDLFYFWQGETTMNQQAMVPNQRRTIIE